MKLPSKQSKLGKVLRAMQSRETLSAKAVRLKAKLPTDTAVTARIRDLRKLGCAVACWSVLQPDRKRVWYYRLESMPGWVGEQLRAENRAKVREIGRAA